MNYYAGIDTNVLVSAMLKYDSIPGNVLELVISGIIIPIVNDEILNEYRCVLKRDKFHFPKETVDEVLNGLIDKAVFIVGEKQNIDLPDSKDMVFYEVVMEANKDNYAYLITGNIKHFPFRHFIVTPRRAFEKKSVKV